MAELAWNLANRTSAVNRMCARSYNQMSERANVFHRVEDVGRPFGGVEYTGQALHDKRRCAATPNMCGVLA